MGCRRATAAAFLGLALALGVVAPAGAVVQPSLDSTGNGGDGPSYGSEAGENGVNIIGEDPGGTTDGDDSSGTVEVGDAPTGPTYEYREVPNCMANAPEGGADALCGAATMSCPDETEINYRIYRRVEGSDEMWEMTGTQCLGPGEDAAPPEPQVTEADVVDAARAAAPDSEVHVEPATESYVNVPNNVYADSDAQTVTVDVLGQAIAVEFAPQRYAWDFGDGGTATGAGVEGADVGAAGAVEHRYRRGGDYGITLTRTYTVSFTLPGGESVTIPGEVSSTSDPYPLTVGEVQSVVTDVE